MTTWKGPGMAIAVVKDDKVVSGKGSGVRELGKSDDLYGATTVTEENGKLVLRFGPSPNFVADLEHWNYDTFQIKWRPSVAYNFPRGFVTFTIDKSGRPADLKIDQPNNDFWFYELALKKGKIVSTNLCSACRISCTASNTQAISNAED